MRNLLCLLVHVSKLYDMFTHSQKLRIRCVFTRNRKWRTLTLVCTRKKKYVWPYTNTLWGVGGGGVRLAVFKQWGDQNDYACTYICNIMYTVYATKQYSNKCTIHARSYRERSHFIACVLIHNRYYIYKCIHLHVNWTALNDDVSKIVMQILIVKNGVWISRNIYLINAHHQYMRGSRGSIVDGVPPFWKI